MVICKKFCLLDHFFEIFRHFCGGMTKRVLMVLYYNSNKWDYNNKSGIIIIKSGIIIIESGIIV